MQNNINDWKNTWKGIKNLIFLKVLPNVAPSSILDNDWSLTGQQDFDNVATDTQSSIKYSKNNFHDFLLPINIYFFINPNNEIKVF